MLIKNQSKTLSMLLGMGIALMIGCATVKMADIPATADPREEISKLDSDLNSAATENIDVLAYREFKKSKSYLAKAKEGLKDGKSQNDILDSLRKGKGYLNEAYSVAGDRSSKAQDLFEARQMAIKAGAGSFKELSDDLERVDEKVSAKADKLDKTEAKTLGELQNRYVELERRAVILSQLSKSQSIINGAEKTNAKRKAPETFKKAQLALSTAETVISTNVRNPEGYREAVEQAQHDANQLKDVLSVIEQNGNNLAEWAALKIVEQKKEINGLERTLTAVVTQNEAEQSAMERENTQLSLSNESKKQELNEVTSKVQIQQALEKAQAQFSGDEAEAYQQGNNLIIRLKQIHFAPGQSDLPADAIPLLAKVTDVAKSLNSTQIKVEGHTDATGSESKNKAISESRAEAVATYLKSNGFADIKVEAEGLGFKKPIASNKSKEGRAQNRRVDIIISSDTSIE